MSKAALNVVWVNKQGRESEVHCARADVTEAHVKYGEFPLACGRLAPYKNDVQEIRVTSSRPTCRICIGRKFTGKLRLK